MNVAPINFGRTIKIAAGEKQAQNIANIANNKSNIQNKNAWLMLREIFYDKCDGEVICHSFNETPSITYMFSGQDSLDVQKIKNMAQEKCIEAFEDYKDNKELYFRVKKNIEKIKNNKIRKIIGDVFEPPTLIIVPDKNNDIKFIDING